MGMDRRDYLTTWQGPSKGIVNVGDLEPSERFGMDVQHTVVLQGGDRDVQLLRQGLEVLRDHKRLQASVGGTAAHIVQIERLIEEIAQTDATFVKEGLPFDLYTQEAETAAHELIAAENN